MRAPPLAALLLLLPLLAGCGYRLTGRGQSLPAGAKRIVIPEFRNSTDRYQVEEFVSSAVRQEFIRRSRLQLVETTMAADLLLEGRIVSFDVQTLAYSEQVTAYSFQVKVVLEARLIDLRTGQTVFESQDISFSDSYETAENADFFSQESETLEEIAGRMAASVVSTILENF